MSESEWCDEHNLEKEYTDEGETIFRCPKCKWDRHQIYLKKWKDLDRQRKKEEGKWF
jgi:hypothetical protein